MPVFVTAANLNRWIQEDSIKKVPKNWKKIVKNRYYTVRDAYDWDKAKEMVYWVNKEHFDAYDSIGKPYDERLWRRVLLTHNKNAKASYRKDIMRMYRQKVKEID